MELTMVAAIINVILLIALLYPTLSNFRKTRSSFSAGLFLFVLVFLVENLVAIYFHLTLVYTPAVEVEIVILTVLQTLSFGALTWVSYK